MASRTPSVYDKWSHEQLVERIRELENQVKANEIQQETQISSFVPGAAADSPEAPPTKTPYIKPAKAPAKPFDASKYSTRLIALKFAYLGQAYNGFEHHLNNKTPLPTIEEELWKALVKTRLINPTPKNNEEVTDYGRLSRKDFEKWDREGAEVNWEGCEYSKCGRTDRGVSAFGQVIGIRVRSNRPLPKTTSVEASTMDDGAEENAESPIVETKSESEAKAPFNDLTDELPYIQLLNRVLPPDIRVYAWCPNPPADFSARFSCKERRYKYFFTNPCFAPVPGASSLYSASEESSAPMREGWLDIEAMQQGCRNLIGLHDFRNFCKIDASKQLTNFKRRIFHASIDEVSSLSLPSFLSHVALQPSSSVGSDAGATPAETPKMYCFTLHGSAFLWHQVRSIVAILFLIGQRLEAPSIIPELLDMEKNPTRPKYEMASDAPLVLWDCIFPAPEEVQSSDEREHGYEDRLEWVYVGDPGGVEPKSRAHASAVGRGKWGRGGVIDDVWELWRQHKMEETLSGLLLDTIASQGKCTLDEEQKREAEEASGAKKIDGMKNVPRVFDGADVGRAKGKYMPVLKRERQDPVELVNERYAIRKGLKDAERKPKEEDADE